MPQKATPAIEETKAQETKQDTLRFTDRSTMQAKIRELGTDGLKGKTLILNGEHIRVIADSNGSLKKAEKMMEEVQSELMKDDILNENKTKITLMFQYSDVLNGKSALGDKYEKYKDILNKYFPGYDSFATTKVFRYTAEK
jgi:hypothetical protein